MHGSIRNNLETVLEGAADTGEVKQHLASCTGCAEALSAMRAQNELFRSLKASEELEPAAGFYARVMQRIEEHVQDSIWAVFVYSPVGKRFAIASLSIALLLGSYVLAEEKMDGHLMVDSTVAEQDQVRYNAPMEGDQAHQRDAVLQNIAAYTTTTAAAAR